MNDKIYVDKVCLQEKIDELKNQFSIMNDVFAKIDNNNKKLPDFWKTETSAQIIDTLNGLSMIFGKYSEQNERYIKFLENIVNTDYEELTNSQTKLIDDNL